MHRKSIYAAALILLSLPAPAQMPAKPGPEVKKLEYFVGSWTSEGTIVQGPWGMGGKFSSANTAEWMPGDFFVVGHADFKMPPEVGGDGKAVAFMGYDTNQNVYTYDAFNSLGRRETSTGTVNGDTWTWTSQANYDGQDIKQKMTMKILSPTSYTVKFEVSLDGTNWMTFMDGKATKK
jgi:Protein of unknown function (DUF1579)